MVTLINQQAPKQKKQQIYYYEHVKWDRIIFDEAHHMRNNKTSTFIEGALGAEKQNQVAHHRNANSKSPNHDFYSLCAQLLECRAIYYTNKKNSDGNS